MLSGKFLLKSSKLINLTSLRCFSTSPAHLGTGDLFKMIESVNSDSSNISTIDEYFRLNFRKLSFDQAFTLLKQVHKVEELEDSFWVWETIEEAVRQRIMEVPYEQAMEISKCFAYFGKGSDYFQTDIYDIENSNAKLF